MTTILDPRLLEIELLSEIDRATWERHDYRYEKASPSNHLDWQRNEAFENLLFEGCVVENDPYHPPSFQQSPQARVSPALPLEISASSGFRKYSAGLTVHFRISQRGRLRLYRLRDEILSRDRIRDDFGILWAKRHFLPDLEVRLRFREPGRPFTLLLLDVDHLKQLNSTLGHHETDQVLKGIYEILRIVTQPYECYLLGGDEAGAILYDVPADTARKVAEEVRTTIAGANLGTRNTHATVSVGVLTTSTTTTAEALYDDAVGVREKAKSRRDSVEVKTT